MVQQDRYSIDLDWVWGAANRGLKGVATLRATISNPASKVAERKVDAWLALFELGEGDSRWRGGWSVEVTSRSAKHVVLELVSGGQDVADSLTDAIESLQDAVLGDGTTIMWEPQSITHRK